MTGIIKYVIYYYMQFSFFDECANFSETNSIINIKFTMKFIFTGGIIGFQLTFSQISC